ncbi:MAG: hypothetical protein HKM99_04565 [Flavobacteriaceae bacterium]|nr:hypothetical protein [Flavobacteriaceae bacterium]
MTPKRRRFFIKLAVIVLLVWTGLTIWGQYSGKDFIYEFKAETELGSALIVFNPDPVYNLDEQVCKSFATGLQERNISSTVATVKSAMEQINDDFDLYVFCVNTYNWTPDWRLTNYIKEHPNLENARVIALTVGAGATMRAQRKLEWHLSDKGADLLGSEMYWLLKPNDENRMKERNVVVANELALDFGKRIGQLILPDQP